MRIERHPKLNIWVREDGSIYLPQNYHRPAHWTAGSVGVKGYRYVMVNKKNYRVHRLVAETYIPNPNGYSTVDHIDRNPANNRVDNLRWADQKMQHDNSSQVLNRSDYGVRACEDKETYNHTYFKAYYARKKASGFRSLLVNGKRKWVKTEVA